MDLYTIGGGAGGGIKTPHDHDVLSGRGNYVNYHPGNEHFRTLVRKHKVAYVACPKPQKGKFSKLIYEEIKMRNPPGRFLKQDPKTKLWIDIGEKKALDKTRQALREGAPEIQKELNGDAYDEGSSDFMPPVLPPAFSGATKVSTTTYCRSKSFAHSRCCRCSCSRCILAISMDQVIAILESMLETFSPHKTL